MLKAIIIGLVPNDVQIKETSICRNINLFYSN